jgi:hypothetical protein
MANMDDAPASQVSYPASHEQYRHDWDVEFSSITASTSHLRFHTNILNEHAILSVMAPQWLAKVSRPARSKLRLRSRRSNQQDDLMHAHPHLCSICTPFWQEVWNVQAGLLESETGNFEINAYDTLPYLTALNVRAENGCGSCEFLRSIILHEAQQRFGTSVHKLPHCDVYVKDLTYSIPEARDQLYPRIRGDGDLASRIVCILTIDADDVRLPLKIGFGVSQGVSIEYHNVIPL